LPSKGATFAVEVAPSFKRGASTLSVTSWRLVTVAVGAMAQDKIYVTVGEIEKREVFWVQEEEKG
jgi:hypothetical protein